MLSPGTYILFGRTGVGKSSLINNVANKSMAPVNIAKACTDEIIEYKVKRPSGEYLIYDTPGFFEDDLDETDQTYLSNLRSFLDDITEKEWERGVCIALVLRMHAPRMRSEDYGVFEYYCELVDEFSRLKPILVFTFAELFDPSFRADYQRAVAQSFIVSDYLSCLNDFNSWSYPFFKEVFAVNNVKKLWLSCSDDSIDLTSIFSADDKALAAEFEKCVGHSSTYLERWAALAKNKFSSSGIEFYKCLVDRVHNLTVSDGSVWYPDPWLKPLTHDPSHVSSCVTKVPERESLFFLGSDVTSSPDDLHAAEADIKAYYYVPSTSALRDLLRSYRFNYHKLGPLRRHFASTGSSEEDFHYFVFLLECRYIAVSVYSISRSGNLRAVLSLSEVLSYLEQLFGRIYPNVSRVVGAECFSRFFADFFLKSQGKSNYFNSLEYAADRRVVEAHLANASTVLFFSTYFLQWTAFPRHPRVFSPHVQVSWSLAGVVDWLNEFCPLKGQVYSPLATAFNLFADCDIQGLSHLACADPFSLQLFVKHMFDGLELSPFMVSSSESKTVSAVNQNPDFVYLDDLEKPW